MSWSFGKKKTDDDKSKGKSPAGKDKDKEKKEEETKEKPKAVDRGTAPYSCSEVIRTFNYTKGTFADVEVVVGPTAQVFTCHRLILATASPVFASMLFANASLGQSHASSAAAAGAGAKGRLRLSLPNVSADEFAALLHVLYFDVLPDKCALNLEKLVQLGRRYQVDKLVAVCTLQLSSDLDEDNALELFDNAVHTLGTANFGLEFICENAEELFFTDAFNKLSKPQLIHLLKCNELSIEESKVFEAVMNWGNARLAESKDLDWKGDESKKNAALAEILRDVLPHVRFPTMPTYDIARIVGDSGLLDQELVLSLYCYTSFPPESSERAAIKFPFATAEREGSVRVDSKIITTPQLRKDLLMVFSPNNKTKPAKMRFELLFRKSKDGPNSSTWHTKVDNKGPTITIFRSGKHIFGGYYGGSWSSSNQYGNSKAWLFSIANPGKSLQKATPSNNSNNVYMCPSYGPTFGGGNGNASTMKV